MKKRIYIGSLAIAKRTFMQCKIGAYGICYKQDTLGTQTRWSFIFENGDYDGFSERDVRDILHFPGVVCDALTGYQFTNVTELWESYLDGIFDPAFVMAKNLDPILIFPAHRGRVS